MVTLAVDITVRYLLGSLWGYWELVKSVDRGMDWALGPGCEG